MAEEYRFKKRAEGPQFEQADELVLWASDDGTLKTTNEDGTVAPVAGAGSLPAATDDGDVLTVVEGEWAGASPGGSVPGSVRLVDGGTIDALDLATNGPTLIYTTTGGEIVYGAQLRNVTLCDVDVGLAVGVLADLVAEFAGDSVVPNSSLIQVHPDIIAATYADYGGEDTGSVDDYKGISRLYTGAISACYVSGRGPVTTAPVAWQANHVYAEGDWVLGGAGYIEKCTTAGTSDASEPAWPSDGSSGIADGSAVWAEAALPTVGSADLSVHVGAPA